MAIIASVFCIPLLVTSSICLAVGSERSRVDGLTMAMFGFQVMISLLQAVAAIVSSVMTCKAICRCCRSTKEDKLVYHSTNCDMEANMEMMNQPNVMPQQQAGSVTIHTSQSQGDTVSGGAIA